MGIRAVWHVNTTHGLQQTDVMSVRAPAELPHHRAHTPRLTSAYPYTSTMRVRGSPTASPTCSYHSQRACSASSREAKHQQNRADQNAGHRGKGAPPG